MPFSSTHVQCRPKPHRAFKTAAHVLQPPDQNAAKKRDFAKGLPPDVLQMFHDAQSNILELNKSRLQALEELRIARDRIQELEETLRVYQENPQQFGASSAKSENGAYSAPSAPSTSQDSGASYGSWTQQGNGAGLAPNPRPPRQDLIRLVYASGWKKAFIHYKKDNEGWTKVPGQPMERGAREYEGMWVAEIEGTSIEFVLTNGDNDWDTPDPSSGTKNYNIRSHGTYKLKSGRVHKLH